MTKEKLISLLNLKPLEIEGGMFSEIYRSNLRLDSSNFPPAFKSKTYDASTSIYFMLGADDTSRMHAVAADETWHFYASSESGVYVSLLVVSSSGDGKIIKLGADIENGQVPQFTVPAGYMMGARIMRDGVDEDFLKRNNSWVLMGATVAPSFEYVDFVRGDAEEIARSCPSLADEILKLG